MTWNDVLIKLMDALIPLVTLVITAALAVLADWLRAKAQKVKQETARDVLLAAIAESEKVAVDAVTATNQVLVEDLKEKSADGKLTNDEMREAMQTSREYFVSHITPGALKVLTAAYGPIEDWIEGFLEAKVGETKGTVYAQIQGAADPLF